MILSNEPGYYKTGGYGIRIENLILVAAREVEGAEKSLLGFDTLTWRQSTAIWWSVRCSVKRAAWLNDYHAQVLEVVGPQLDGEVLAWVREACAPL
jgi:Xaa-Pro aminopeptidase